MVGASIPTVDFYIPWTFVPNINLGTIEIDVAPCVISIAKVAVVDVAKASGKVDDWLCIGSP